MARATTVAALALFALSASALVGCGGSDEPGGYLAKASDGAIFIQWTRTDDSVSGSITIAHREASDDGYEAVQKENVAFNGTINGSSVTLSIAPGLGATNWNGTLDGHDLTLTVAADDGSLTTLHFKPADVSAYNQAVGDLQSAVAASNDQQAQADADAATAQSIDDASGTVSQDLASLDQHVQDAQTALSSVSTALGTEQQGVAATYEALQTTLATGPDDICYAADDTTYAANDVEYEKNDVEYALNDLNSSIATVSDDLKRIRADFAGLQGALGALPSYRPDGLPTKADIADARARASADLARIISTGRGYRKKAVAMVKTANGYAARAHSACGG